MKTFLTFDVVFNDDNSSNSKGWHESFEHTYDVVFQDDNSSNSKGWHESFEHTYDVVFQDDISSNCKGWHETFEYCKNYIERNNGTNNSYFADYKGGTVSIYCNETGEEVYTLQCK